MSLFLQLLAFFAFLGLAVWVIDRHEQAQRRRRILEGLEAKRRGSIR